MKTDIEIAQEAKMLPITEVAAKLGITEDEIELYGKLKAKIIPHSALRIPNSKLVLVSAINPTPAGEGKTTVTVGLGDALASLGKKAVIALREPSLGPVFGVKGGAAGGGYAQVVPMEDINLHFTGDMHAIGAANNLIAAMLDNHIFQGNALNIDVRKITWRRCVDMNDRQLRNITNGLGGRINGTPREDGYDITVASEIMAVLCLCDGIEDLKKRIADIIIGYTYDDKPVTVGQLKADGAAAALLKDAVMPNLVQTLENTPAFIHGGPFANIAHGCNSVIATKMAMKYGEYTVTEAGFGADLGAEKFIDIKCRKSGLRPDCVVLVATVRALKSHGGVNKEDLQKENLDALKNGMENLYKHIENITNVWGLPCAVAINKFPTDTDVELSFLQNECEKKGVTALLTEVWGKGGEGGTVLAKEVINLCEKENNFSFTYEDSLTIEEKIEAVAKKIYGADGVEYMPAAKKEIEKLTSLGFQNLPVCMAKTQYSLSDDMKKISRPKDFKITVKNIRISAGAGFIVVLTGDILTMPGLPKVPSAEKIDIDKDGVISGLF